MLLNNINHKMPIYKDCTLSEMLCIGAIVFIFEMIVFSMVAWLLFGYASIGVALTFISFFHVTKSVLNQLQKVKYGKPHGYYQQWLVKKSANCGLIRSLYLTRCGKWSMVRKGVKNYERHER